MKITPVATPHAVAPTQSSAAQAKARAIEAFKNASPTQGQQQETPVSNPNQIAPEEISAIKQQAVSEVVEEQQPVLEKPAEEAPKPVEEKPVSQEWAKLARQEKALRAKAQQQEQLFKQREAALQAREAEAAQKSEINQKGFISLDSLKNDPIGILERAGVTYDELANQMLNPSKVDPRTKSMLDQLQAKIDALEKATEEGNKRSTQQQQDAYNAAVRQIELDAKALVKSDPDTYEAISKGHASIKDVVELITETYNKDGILMTVEEAAQEVENYVIEELDKALKLKKIQSRRASTPVQGGLSKTQSPSSNQAASQPSIKTLTNATASTRKLSARERAMLAFKNELKG